MPHPGAGFPVPPFEWPHVGRQWPPYNLESRQAVDLEGWWPTLASRGAGVLRDLSGHGHDGTIYGATWVQDAEHGSVLSFDGNDYVSVPDHSRLDITANITFGAWVKNTNSINWDVILSKGAYNNAYTLYLSDSEVVYLHVAGSERNTGITIVNDVWTHLIVTHDGAHVRFYIDGIQRYSVADTDATATNADPLYIGKESGGNQFLGLIDDARVSPRCFTAADVWQVYANPWDLHQLPRRLWRLGVVAPPPPTIIPVAMHHYRSMRL